jgi:multidrug efflux system membrane fusion protein
VRPPLHGEIERRLVNTGQWVSRGTAIATIVKRRPLRLRFTLGEEESARVRPSIQVRFEVPAYPGEAFRAELFFIAGAANARTRRVDCLASVGNEDERLKAGFFARVSIEERSREDAILVPETAVLATERGFVAFVVVPPRDPADRSRPGAPSGTAERRLVETGLRTPEGRVEVRRGIERGELVVVRGAGLLDHGVPVAIEKDEEVR